MFKAGIIQKVLRFSYFPTTLWCLFWIKGYCYESGSPRRQREALEKLENLLFSNTKHEISLGLYQSPMDPRNTFLRLLYPYHVKLKYLTADRGYRASLQPNCFSNASFPIRVHSDHSLSQVYFSSLSSNKSSGIYPRQLHCFKLSMI
jgi:hypothetical protein